MKQVTNGDLLPPVERSLLQMHLDFATGVQPLPDDEAMQVRKFRDVFADVSFAKRRRSYWRVMKPKIKMRRALPVLFAMAAGLLVLVLPKMGAPEWTAKGGVLVRVVVEDATGTRHFWQEGEKLKSGDKFNAEIRANAATTAYLVVYGQNGKILQSSNEIIANALSLRPTSLDHFDHGIELVGPSEGESMMVIACVIGADGDDEKSLGTSLKKVLEANIKHDNVQALLPKTCSHRIFSLRGAL